MRTMVTHLSEKRFPVKAEDYKLYEEVGDGVSATVYRALCIPLNEVVAIKVLDLEKCNNDLDGIRREVQTMSLIEHPNVLQAHCSFTAGHNLWVVMPYMAGGSCMHIMKSAYSEGFEEHAISTLLCETLKALVYLHAHGHIHRDVKAGNILIDSNGTVKLADFGVSACMFDTGDRQRSRNTFVGTPCWMAPEVMQQSHGYDFKADIWSFGITALELARGHAPFSKYPPMKVLLMTLQNAPPGLDYERDKKFSKSFKEMVAACLVKDPKKRPTSQKLLKHQFFKHARSTDYLARTVLHDLPPLGERYRVLKAKEADLVVQNRALYENKEQLSQQEYIRGISAWNFNLEDLKSQAALIQDKDLMSNGENPDVNCKQRNMHNSVGLQADMTSPLNSSHLIASHNHEDEFDDLNDLESSLASFPIKPLQALKGCFDVGEEDEDASNSNGKDGDVSDSSQLRIRESMSKVYQNGEETKVEKSQESGSVLCQATEPKKFFSGSLVFDNNGLSPSFRELLHPKYHRECNYSGSLLCQQRRDTNNLSSEDASEGAIVTHKGRFKVTSADLSPKEPTNCSPNSVNGGAVRPASTNHVATSVLTSLHCLLQQNTVQREEILRLIKYVEQFSGRPEELSEISSDDLLQISPSVRERELESQVVQLEQSNGSMDEELQRLKTKNAQLQKLVRSRKDNGAI